MTIKRPSYRTISIEECRKLKGPNLRFEEKMDGRWQIGNNIGAVPTIGELMPDGRFVLFDIVFDGVNLKERLNFIDALNIPGVLRPSAFKDGSAIDEILARGGEGMVIKDLNGLFGDEWLRCKRNETFDLTVTEKNQFGKSSIRLSDGRNDRGWCPCRSMFDRLFVGDIVEVSAFGLTKNGKLREPRFIRSRPDKLQAS